MVVAEEPQPGSMVFQEPLEKISGSRGAEHRPGIRSAEATGMLPGQTRNVCRSVMREHDPRADPQVFLHRRAHQCLGQLFLCKPECLALFPSQLDQLFPVARPCPTDEEEFHSSPLNGPKIAQTVWRQPVIVFMITGEETVSPGIDLGNQLLVGTSIPHVTQLNRKLGVSDKLQVRPGIARKKVIVTYLSMDVADDTKRRDHALLLSLPRSAGRAEAAVPTPLHGLSRHYRTCELMEIVKSTRKNSGRSDRI